MAYEVKEKMFTFADEYKIKDHHGQEAFTVKGKSFTGNSMFRHRVTICDAEGRKLCVIQKQLKNVRRAY